MMNQVNSQVTKFYQNQHFTHLPVFSNQIDFWPQMAPMNRSYGMWGTHQQFHNPNLSSDAMKPPSAFNKSFGPRSNWKGKRANKPIDRRAMEQLRQLLVNSGGIGGGDENLNFRNYNPPTTLKARKTFPKKKLNKNMNMNMNTNMAGNGGRSAPFAPRNTTSYLMRAKRSGGIAPVPVVSPFPVTPSVLPTPILSPSTEVLGNMAKEEWGVDGYGSMKGLIRLRSLGHESGEEDGGGSSESEVDEHVEVERRLDHDLSRFEMIYDPNSGNAGGAEYHNVLENRVDDQDSHIAQLEEENLILKQRLFLMEEELGDLRRRLLSIESRGGGVDDSGEEVVENESENERESNGENTHSTGENDEEDEDRCEVGESIVGGFGGGFEGEGEGEETRERLSVEGELESGNEGSIATDKDYDADSDDSDCIEADKCGADMGSEVERAANVVDDQSCKPVVECDACMIESERVGVAVMDGSWV